jgi:hypothetical protein
MKLDVRLKPNPTPEQQPLFCDAPEPGRQTRNFLANKAWPEH